MVRPVVAPRRPRRQKFEGNVPGLAELRAATHRNLAVLDRVPRQWLRLVTVIITAIKVKLTDDVASAVAAEMAKFEPEFRGCAMVSGRLTRGTRWAGVIEIDLAHPAFLKVQKRKLLQCFGIEDIAADDRVIIVHLHAVVDFRGHASPDVFVRDLRKAFPGPNRIDARRMHEDKTMAQNLDRIAGYCTKHMRAYSVWGEEENGRTRFYSENEPEWSTWMDRLYTNISIDNTLFSSVSSRSASEPECKAESLKTLILQGVSRDEETEELIHIRYTRDTLKATRKDITEHSPATHQHASQIIWQRSQMIAEQCTTPFDDDKPMAFYLMKQIMQKAIGASLPINSFIQIAS